MGLMNAIHRWTAPKAGRVTETSSFGWAGGLMPWSRVSSGEVVTESSALASSAVYASVRVLAETISSLPIKIYQTMPDGGKRLATEHPLNVPLRVMPNRSQDRVQYLDQGMTYLNLFGNQYSRIVSGPRFGAVDELVPIHPNAIQDIKRLDNGRLRYDVCGSNGQVEELSQDEVLHISGPISLDGVRGLSPIMAHREGIGLDLAAEKHGAKVFGNGAVSQTNLEIPVGTDLSEDGIRNMVQSWINMNGGENQLGVSHTRDGIKAVPMSMTSEDAQYVGTRKFQVSDIARIFRVPPHLIGDLDRSTFNNVEEMGIAFVEYSLVPWLTRIELAWMTQLMSQQDLEAGFFIEFVVAGLLRGSVDKRYNSYDIAIRNGIMSPNEARRLENMNPRDGGDEYVASQNTRPSGGGFDAGVVALLDTDEPVAVAEPVEPSAFVLDAAKRIANAEIREISKRIKHAGVDRDKFDAWFISYLSGGKHRKYVTQTIEPFGCTQLTIDAICNPHEFVALTNIKAAFAVWKENRATRISDAVIITMSGGSWIGKHTNDE